MKADSDWAPRDWIMASYRFADPCGVLTLRYRFDPEEAGFAPDGWGDALNGWRPEKLEPRQHYYLRRMGDWAWAARPHMRHAFETGAVARISAP